MFEKSEKSQKLLYKSAVHTASLKITWAKLVCASLILAELNIQLLLFRFLI